MIKNIVLPFFLLLMFTVDAQIPFFSANKNNFFHLPAEANHLKAAFIEAEHAPDWDLTYNKIKLVVDPNKSFISGSVYFEFQALTNHLKLVTIDLSNDLSVLSVTSQNQALSFKHANNKVEVSLQNELAINEKSVFTISYEGKPTSRGFGAFSQKADSSLQVIYTLSEPYGAMEWWPCKQSLADKIDSIDIEVTSPEKYTTASNGILVANTVKKGFRTCHWKHRYPIATYLVFFSTTDYVVYNHWATLESGSKVEILNYVYKNKAEETKQKTLITAEYLKLFSKLFIDYPFKNEKYGHAQFGWGGGMEHQTMSSMGGFQAYLIAHELAHQWFGDYITCGSWTDIWLNEGFATFLSSLVYEHLDPYWYPIWKSSIIENVVSEPGGSVYCTDTINIWRIFDSRLSYDKGGFVLHMLRGQIGDDAFFKGVNNYLTDRRATHGFASTALLRQNIELAADTVLKEFFEDWVYGEGYPVYNIGWNYSNKVLNVFVGQSPSVENGPLFDMKIPVRYYVNGDSATVWLHNTLPTQQFNLPMSQRPDSLKVDPDQWILGIFSKITYVETFKQNEYTIITYSGEGVLFVDVNSKVETAKCSIFNLNGKKLIDGKWDKTNKKIDISNLRTGIYLLQFKSDDVVFTSKFSITQ